MQETTGFSNLPRGLGNRENVIEEGGRQWSSSKLGADMAV